MSKTSQKSASALIKLKIKMMCDGDFYYGQNTEMSSKQGRSHDIVQSFAMLSEQVKAFERGERQTPPRVLELGCGKWDQPEEWAKTGAHVTALDRCDISADMEVYNTRLKQAGREPIDYHRVDITDNAALENALAGKMYDVIVMEDVLQFIEEDKAPSVFVTLREHAHDGTSLHLSFLTGLLRENGTLSINTTAEERALQEGLAKEGKKPALTYVHDTGKTEALLKQLGFGNIQEKFRGGHGTTQSTINAAALLLFDMAFSSGKRVRELKTSAKHVAGELSRRDKADAHAYLRWEGQDRMGFAPQNQSLPRIGQSQINITKTTLSPAMYRDALELAYKLETDRGFKLPENPKNHYYLTASVTGRSDLAPLHRAEKGLQA